ncbi:hypothetical protein SNE40_015675 [Patella caerulea]|uniref:Uncharacterized protein n=1 Tax=Patella caerulea TaxID=87958 RepID=A0AAN8JIH4_PATCE
MSTEAKKTKRRRSSLCPNRISLLPSEVIGNVAPIAESSESKKFKSEIAGCILSTLEAVSAEINTSDGVSVLTNNPDALANNIVDMLELPNQEIEGNKMDDIEEQNESPDSKPTLDDKEMEVRIKTKIENCKEEYKKWEHLLKKMQDDANDDTSFRPNETVRYEDISDAVKTKAANYMPNKFSYEKVLFKCQKLSDETLIIMDDCAHKTNTLYKIQQRIKDLLDSQYEKLNVEVHETSSTVESDVRQLIENRISIISPVNNKK